MTGSRIAEALLGVVACALAVYIAWGTYTAPAIRVRSVVGPGVFPTLVAIGLLLVGLRLLWEARSRDLPALEIPPIDWPAVMTVGLALLAFVWLLERLGWILAGTLLFMAVAHGFGGRRWWLNALIGLALTALTLAVFDWGLGLSLPEGSWIEPLLDAPAASEAPD